jgi:hypothetical protein
MGETPRRREPLKRGSYFPEARSLPPSPAPPKRTKTYREPERGSYDMRTGRTARVDVGKEGIATHYAEKVNVPSSSRGSG